jgi:hypothetical protein
MMRATRLEDGNRYGNASGLGRHPPREHGPSGVCPAQQPDRYGRNRIENEYAKLVDRRGADLVCLGACADRSRRYGRELPNQGVGRQLELDRQIVGNEYERSQRCVLGSRGGAGLTGAAGRVAAQSGELGIDGSPHLRRMAGIDDPLWHVPGTVQGVCEHVLQLVVIVPPVVRHRCPAPPLECSAPISPSRTAASASAGARRSLSRQLGLAVPTAMFQSAAVPARPRSSDGAGECLFRRCGRVLGRWLRTRFRRAVGSVRAGSRPRAPGGGGAGTDVGP